MNPWLLQVLLQVVDGVLTYFGVCSFGLRAEGNPIIRFCMAGAGVLLGLVLVKVLAIALVLGPIRKRNIISERVLSYVNLFYAGSAVLWILILFGFIKIGA